MSGPTDIVLFVAYIRALCECDSESNLSQLFQDVTLLQIRSTKPEEAKMNIICCVSRLDDKRERTDGNICS